MAAPLLQIFEIEKAKIAKDLFNKKALIANIFAANIATLVLQFI